MHEVPRRGIPGSPYPASRISPPLLGRRIGDFCARAPLADHHILLIWIKMHLGAYGVEGGRGQVFTFRSPRRGKVGLSQMRVEAVSRAHTTSQALQSSRMPSQ